ncbi:MAG: hypothetical protein FWB92_10930 [Oscillospiraceae bacterium]|nr:hypothetical protein [Oscillospiraceae bacterium]
MKIMLFLSLLILSCVLLLACGDDSRIEPNTDTNDSVVFTREFISLTVPDEIIGLWVSDNRIFYYNFAPDTQNVFQLVVTSMDVDGENRQKVNLPVYRSNFIGINHVDESYFEVLLSDEEAVVYIKFNQSGQEINRQDFSGVEVNRPWQPPVNHVFFTDCGHVLFAKSDTRSTEVYILNMDDGYVETVQFNDPVLGITSLEDGRVIACFRSDNGIVFKGIDVLTGEVIGVYHSSISHVLNMFPNDTNSHFDLIINDNMYLFGYILETREQINILNWIEAGFPGTFDAHIAIVPDSHVFILKGSRSDCGDWDANIHFLVPSERDETKKEITLTLGGLFINDEVRRAVVEFNMENNAYQILIHDYSNEAGGWEAGLLRLQTELIAGRGPDILYDPFEDWAANSFLVDLYPFLDADSELSRTDFFPNVLRAQEVNDSLTTISSGFIVLTMIGTVDTLGHIEPTSWTPQEMLRLLENNNQMPIPFGRWMDRENFINIMIQFSGDDYINWSTGEVNLYSEEFIELLNIATLLPGFGDMVDESDYDYVSEFERLYRGKQLLALNLLGRPDLYQVYSVGWGGVYTLGVPTFEGGRHIIQPKEGRLGISAASENPDEAWLFLRRFLLPSFEGEGGFPIRIDSYDKLIDEFMTPIIVDGVELPRQYFGFATGDIVPLYAMTQAEADSLRSIIYSAVPIGRGIRDRLWNLIRDDLNAFFFGVRGVEDTARVIQNRVQIYLYEQR